MISWGLSSWMGNCLGLGSRVSAYHFFFEKKERRVLGKK